MLSWKRRVPVVGALVVAALVVCTASSAFAQASEALAARSQKTGGKLTIALIPIDAKNNWTKPIMAASFEDSLMKAGRFKVLSRSQLDAVMAEQHLGTEGLVDPTQAVKIGKALAANYVLVVKQLSIDSKKSVSAVTSFTGFGKKKTTYTLNLQAQVMDAETTELVQSESFTKVIELSATVLEGKQTEEDPSVTGPYKSALDEFAGAFTTKLAAALPLEALVVMVRDAKNIALGVGTDAGLRVGTEFELFEEGQPIKAPNGDILGYDSRKVAVVKVSRVEAKLTWAELLTTFAADGTAESTPDVGKVKQYLVAKMSAGSK